MTNKELVLDFFRRNKGITRTNAVWYDRHQEHCHNIGREEYYQIIDQLSLEGEVDVVSTGITKFRETTDTVEIVTRSNNCIQLKLKCGVVVRAFDHSDKGGTAGVSILKGPLTGFTAVHVENHPEGFVVENGTLPERQTYCHREEHQKFLMGTPTPKRCWEKYQPLIHQGIPVND